MEANQKVTWFSEHALEQMEKRGIDKDTVPQILQQHEGVKFTQKAPFHPENSRISIEDDSTGIRIVYCDHPNYRDIITVMWRNPFNRPFTGLAEWISKAKKHSLT